MPDITPKRQELISKHDLWDTTTSFVAPVKPLVPQPRPIPSRELTADDLDIPQKSILERSDVNKFTASKLKTYRVFARPPLTGVTPYTHAIFVYFTFRFFPNSSRYIAAAPRTNYIVLLHNHKPQRSSIYV